MSPNRASLVVAKVVTEAAKAYHEATDPTLKQNLKTIIYYTCRKMEDFVRPKVSKRATQKAKDLRINLSQLTWAKQTKVDPKRRTFHFDHLEPPSKMRDLILNIQNPTVESVEAILRSADIAWILKSEDKELTKLGYRSNRKDWKKCYREASIELVD